MMDSSDMPTKSEAVDLVETAGALSDGHIDPVREKQLVRRIDRNLLPILWVLYLCAFIDRVNIGNARIQGLQADLNMSGSDYNIALFMFFIPYILCEVPSNMILKRVRPSLWLPGIISGWGIITICQGTTQSFAGLVVCRVLIGIFEAGYFPGMVYLISMFYKREEFQWRLNLLFSAAILAGAFSGLLAYAIANMDGVAGYSGWRWIFILEGFATVVIAICGVYFVADWPETAKFLTNEDRQLLRQRMAGQQEDFRMDHLNKAAAKRVFSDVKIYLGAFMFFGVSSANYGLTFFIPTILKQLGWTSIRAQVMSIPIWVVATVLALATAFASDRLKHRFAFIVSGCLISITGLGMLFAIEHIPVGARYFAVYLIIGGGYIAAPITVGWLNNNLSGHYKRGIGAAIQVAIGNFSGILGSNIFLEREAPSYPTGFGVALGMVCVTVIASVLFYVWIKRENRFRDSGGRDDRYQLPEEEQHNLGDEHPAFRYMA